MKRIFLLVVPLLVFSMVLSAQTPAPAVDKSPMDISYYPDNFPVLKIRDKVTEPLMVRVLYSRPKKENRAIFGSLVEYGKLWRLGANEATEIEFYKIAKINGKKVAKGRYTLYAVVNENSWTFVINKETDTWGSFKYDAAKDVARIDVPVQKTTENIESLSMAFENNKGTVQLIVSWENVKAALPITF